MKYLQGKYKLKNPEKYVGDPDNIVFRSSWELRVLVWLDTNKNIISFASEEMNVPYVSPVDGRVHRYFPDFLIKYKSNDNQIKKAMLEIKPNAQTKMPKKRKQTKAYLNEVTTYAVNTAKWEAATVWCKNNGFDFIIVDEYMIGLKK